MSKQVAVPLIKIKGWVGLGVEVRGFEGHDLRLRAASDIVTWLIGHANGTTIREYADIDGGNMVIHLDRIEQLQQVLTYIEPKELNFSEEGAVLTADIML